MLWGVHTGTWRPYTGLSHFDLEDSSQFVTTLGVRLFLHYVSVNKLNYLISTGFPLDCFIL